MNVKIVISVILVVVAGLIIFQFLSSQSQNDSVTSYEMERLDIKSLFDVYGINNEYTMKDGKRSWTNMKFELNPESDELYNELRYDSNKKLL